MSIKSVKARKKLPPSNTPYWESLGHGKTLGYRVHKNGTAVWVAKYQMHKQRKIESLEDISHIAESEQFNIAVKLANEWFHKLGSRSGAVTIGSLCNTYAFEKADKNNLLRYKQLIESDPIASVSLFDLNDSHIEIWKRTHEKSKATASRNRQRTFLRAALNSAYNKKLIKSNESWRHSLRADRARADEVVSRSLCYDRKQCALLVNSCAKNDFANLCRVLCVIPLRVGVLAHALVCDYNATQHNFYVRRDKSHQGRTIPVPDGLHELFLSLQRGKQPNELLFTNEGKQWTRNSWTKPMKKAAKAAGLSDETVMYTLRHSVITELCIANMDLMSVAKIAGTSLEMIEKHYGHLRQNQASSLMNSIMV